MKICVFGLWHLGSVICASLAKSGHTVVGLDFNRENIENFRNAKAPVSEPGLNELILENLQKKSLRFTCDPAPALTDAEVVWIAFDTPVDEQDNADPSYIEKNFEIISRIYTEPGENYHILTGSRWIHPASFSEIP